MGRSQRHLIEEQGFSVAGKIYDEGAINDAVLKSIGGSIASGIEANRPVLSSISPTTAAVGAAAFTLTATGTLFTDQCSIYFKGVKQTTTYVSATSLTTSLTLAPFGVGTWNVQVVKGNSLPSAATKPFIVTA